MPPIGYSVNKHKANLYTFKNKTSDIHPQQKKQKTQPPHLFPEDLNNISSLSFLGLIKKPN